MNRRERWLRLRLARRCNLGLGLFNAFVAVYHLANGSRWWASLCIVWCVLNFSLAVRVDDQMADPYYRES